MSIRTEQRSNLPYVSLGLGAAAVVLVTIVSFIAMALGVGAIVTGLLAAGRSADRRPFALLGAILGFGAIAFFVVSIL